MSPILLGIQGASRELVLLLLQCHWRASLASAVTPCLGFRTDIRKACSASGGWMLGAASAACCSSYRTDIVFCLKREDEEESPLSVTPGFWGEKFCGFGGEKERQEKVNTVVWKSTSTPRLEKKAEKSTCESGRACKGKDMVCILTRFFAGKLRLTQCFNVSCYNFLI